MESSSCCWVEGHKDKHTESGRRRKKESRTTILFLFVCKKLELKRLDSKWTQIFEMILLDIWMRRRVEEFFFDLIFSSFFVWSNPNYAATLFVWRGESNCRRPKRWSMTKTKIGFKTKTKNITASVLVSIADRWLDSFLSSDRWIRRMNFYVWKKSGNEFLSFFLLSIQSL